MLSAIWLSRRPAFLPLAIPFLWFVAPFTLFSSVATRMPAYVMIGAPAIFLLHANAWWTLADASRHSRARHAPRYGCSWS